MQEETNEKTIALYIKTGKLTAQQLQKAMKALLAQMKKQHDRQKIPHGKQTLKQLMKQNAGVSNIEITKDNIKAFESTAKKYGIDFALKKDSTETPPRYLVFFKGRDADALTAAFKEFSARTVKQKDKPSLRRKLSHEQEQVKKTTELFGNIKESVNGVIEVQQQIAAAVDTCNETADQIQGDILSAKDGYIGVSETVNQLSGDITRKNQLYENMINLLDQVDPIVEEVQKTHINI